MTETFVADTYALIEIIKGNPNYKQYLLGELAVTEGALVELYYHCLHDYGEEAADNYLDDYKGSVVPISSECIKNAMKFKLANKKEKLSYVDCIGYALAQEMEVRFLTGDQKFKDRANVEFVK